VSNEETTERLSERQRREIFQALVEAQDNAMTVRQSRKVIAERFGISEKEMKEIEIEGLDRQWPPL
jgi:4-hydroxy-3-methylbut-2-enyl diphosphate reductase IspH